MKKILLHSFDLILITAFTIYVLLDTFVIPRTYAAQTDESTDASQTSSSSSNAVITDTTYSDDNITIAITSEVYEDTTVYTADIQVSDVSYLKTALANGTYGKNITATTSEIASSNDAILAINGDYYGAQNSGYVVRNGTVYRSTASGNDQEDLVIKSDGSFAIINEGTVDETYLESDDILQVLSFGPALIESGEVSVTANDEVGKAMTSNPRTAICEIAPLHYLFVVADGRTSESEGLSLYQLAAYLEGKGVKTAYNLDGGGSSTMVFNETVINKPTTNGDTISERSVSDIVYIGY
jgi:exopolysaccharide biosynthesis protein